MRFSSRLCAVFAVAAICMWFTSRAAAQNQPPELAAIGVQSVTEGFNLNFAVAATDADGDSLILSAVNVPTNATFTDNYDGTGTFDFTPDYDQAGVYNVTFIASDGSLADTEIVAITVVNRNRSPELETIFKQYVTVGLTLIFEVSATDPDGTIPTLYVASLPPNATFTDHGDGTGTFVYSPDLTTSQEILVTVVASDGEDSDAQMVHIFVYIDPGQPDSVIVDIASSTCYDNDSLVVPIIVSNDQALLQLSIPLHYYSPDDYWLLDSGHVFWESTRFSSAPIKGLENRPDEAQDSLKFLIWAQETLDSMVAGRDVIATLHFFKNPTLPPETIPYGSLCIEATQVGPYAEGSGQAMMFISPANPPEFWHPRIVARVGEDEYEPAPACLVYNQAPVLDSIGAREVNELANLNFDISASDPDGDSLILSAVEMPTGATFVDNFDGTGTFDWTPPGHQGNGYYFVRFIASDGALADTEIVEITVIDINAILETGESEAHFEYALAQNYPNPFNASTRINFSLEKGGVVNLEVFNILGQKVAAPIANRYLKAGPHAVVWDGRGFSGKAVSSGMYFYRLTTAEFLEMKKMVLTK